MKTNRNLIISLWVIISLLPIIFGFSQNIVLVQVILISILILNSNIRTGIALLQVSFIADAAFYYLDLNDYLASIRVSTFDVDSKVLTIGLLLISIIYFVLAEKIISQPEWADTDIHKWRALFDQSNDGVLILDLNQEIISANRIAEDILGYGPDELVGMSRKDLLKPDDWEATMIRQYHLMSGKRPENYRRTYVKKNGGHVLVDANTTLIYSTENKPLFIQTIFGDLSKITEHENKFTNLQNESEIQARIDSQTSILNELALRETAGIELESAKLNTKPLSFILLDIQNFSGHNDKFGQKSGDNLLKWISQHMLRLIRTSDLLGRWKDDKFIFILPGSNREDCTTVTNRIEKYLLHNPFTERDTQIKVKTTLVTVTVSGSDFPANIVDTIFDQLTESLNEAKIKNSRASKTITY